MSRHAFGTVWNQGVMFPMHHGSQAGESFPKKVPVDGCGFNGVPGDVPLEKQLWYTRSNSLPSGASSLTRGGRTSGNLIPKSTGAVCFNPDGTAVLATSSSSRSLAREVGVQRQSSYADLPDGREISHQMLYYGRNRAMPETLRTAGVSTFKMRRFQETNTSVPRLEH
eukprot:TRINITY_DN23704_c0_g1_i1.p1 TRINITY_DN23704_c0_g1~~TRINITY_DN23704_c0_g1_i1.p1  ORF type:complete len:168 (+),score=20.26 TRINITY_DN23704_c0_g1_i1:124-627(+)